MYRENLKRIYLMKNKSRLWAVGMWLLTTTRKINSHSLRRKLIPLYLKYRHQSTKSNKALLLKEKGFALMNEVTHFLSTIKTYPFDIIEKYILNGSIS